MDLGSGRRMSLRHNASALEMEDMLLEKGVLLSSHVTRTLVGNASVIWSFASDIEHLTANPHSVRPIHGAVVTATQGLKRLNASGNAKALLTSLANGVLRSELEETTCQLRISLLGSDGVRLMDERLSIHTRDSLPRSLLRVSNRAVVKQTGVTHKIDFIHVKAIGASATRFIRLNLSTTNGSLSLPKPQRFGVQSIETRNGVSLRGPGVRLQEALQSVEYLPNSGSPGDANDDSTSPITAHQYLLRTLDTVTTEYLLRLPDSNCSVLVSSTTWSEDDLTEHNTSANRSIQSVELPCNASGSQLSTLLGNISGGAAVHVAKSDEFSRSLYAITISVANPHLRVELSMNASSGASLTQQVASRSRFMVQCGGQKLSSSSSEAEVLAAFRALSEDDVVKVGVRQEDVLTTWTIERPFASSSDLPLCSALYPAFLCKFYSVAHFQNQ